MFECIADIFLSRHRLSSSFLFLSLFSLFPCFQNVTFSPLSFLHVLHTCSPLASLSLPLSLPHQVSAPLSPPLSYSSVFSLPPLHSIQLYNHIIKQHYCICNHVWIISRWTALTALNSFSVSPLSFRGELVLFKWDEWWRGTPWYTCSDRKVPQFGIALCYFTCTKAKMLLLAATVYVLASNLNSNPAS